MRIGLSTRPAPGPSVTKSFLTRGLSQPRPVGCRWQLVPSCPPCRPVASAAVRSYGASKDAVGVGAALPGALSGTPRVGAASAGSSVTLHVPSGTSPASAGRMLLTRPLGTLFRRTPAVAPPRAASDRTRRHLLLTTVQRNGSGLLPDHPVLRSSNSEHDEQTRLRLELSVH